MGTYNYGHSDWCGIRATGGKCTCGADARERVRKLLTRGDDLLKIAELRQRITELEAENERLKQGHHAAILSHADSMLVLNEENERLKARRAVVCEECNAQGRINEPDIRKGHYFGDIEVDCPDCNGSGAVMEEGE